MLASGSDALATPSAPIAIIPAFNEEIAIASVVTQLVALGFHVVVVDDCSNDDTRKVAAKAGAVVLRHACNLGYACALQTGYLYARRNGYQALIQLDGDGQHDPNDAHKLLQTLMEKKCDVVIGSRFLGLQGYQVSRLRRMGQYFFGSLLNFLTGMNISDPTSGFQALNSHVMEFYCSRIFPDDFPDANILMLLHRKGFRVIDVPVRMFPSASGSMHSGFYRSFYYVIKMTFSLFMSLLLKLPSSDNQK
ncbi:MAG: glycosyltransferase family 2 protein [Nitrospirae bacterium]|nr:glycosyltransferase family 2 protein [Magnetococcales bacterium]HAT50708.1 glycosyl transferase family 2 [Alphaproteobacteria bacterium]